MEHRYNDRVSIQMRVTVHYGPIGWLTGRIRNISVGGAFIVLTGVRPPLHAPVTLALDFHGNEGDTRLRWPAMVVRTDDRGIGVAYLERTEGMADALRWIVEQWADDAALAPDLVGFDRSDKPRRATACETNVSRYQI